VEAAFGVNRAFETASLGAVSLPADAAAAHDSPPPALVAVYDSLTSTPRVERVEASSARELIETLAARTYHLSHEAGGQVPFTVIREVVENFIHAGFDEVVVSILDGGSTIRFADQGPGIPDKERAFLPGFSTATGAMKSVIKGVGSGLPVARECLAFSGGTIEIEDNLRRGTVVTIRLAPAAPPRSAAPAAPSREEVVIPPLTVRQKQVLSLALELGSVGPTVVSRELGVGLSTAYRDLEHLAGYGLITSDDAGKRVLTDAGIACLDALFGR
jgi:anti-sigma regulatory factor (Ser/Thr protein kinase)